MTSDLSARPAVADHPSTTYRTSGAGVLPMVLAACLLFTALFTACWVGAFHHSSPHGVPVGVVGNVQVPGGSSVAVRRYGDESALVHAIEHGTVVGGLSVAPGRATVYVAQAQGRTTSEFVTGLLSGTAAHIGAQVTVRPMVPLSAGDVGGVVPFFVVLSLLVPSLIAGALIGLTPALRRVAGVVALAGFSALAALVNWLLTDRWLGAISGNTVGYVGVVFVYVLAVAGTSAGLAAWRRPLVAVAGVLFLALAVPATGGPAALGYFVPVFFRDLKPWLPPSAAVDGMRAAEWFHGSGLRIALLVLTVWALAGMTALVVRGLATGHLTHGRHEHDEHDDAHPLDQGKVEEHAHDGVVAAR